MTYFADLSERTVEAPAFRPIRNVGWLDQHHEFATKEPAPKLLDAVWEHCRILVDPTRGLHRCAFCPQRSHAFTRQDTTLLLGSGEIRVFGANGDAFAAPNLIYHYIVDHHYHPPEQFLRAIDYGLSPGSDEYVDLLKRLNVGWRENLPIMGEPKTFFFVRTEKGVEARDPDQTEGE